MSNYRSLLTCKAPLCSSGKRGFADGAAADRELMRVRRLRRADPTAGRKPGRVERAIYRCAACGWWHLTASGPRSRGPRGRTDRARSPRGRRR
ncbi:hypothetical protein ATL51_0195 [Pseudonocardia alni]|jgi:hypothetical protein|uniref:Uncharacterized protein n=1 Tax=Pseudonocardia alni TaxID=33907 RepID=A0AA44UUR6_PSEA5|nr:hypothetical protein ATL51_0195 [Pseudonocardia alni]